MDVFFVVLVFVGGVLLAIGLGVFGALHRRPRELPKGYSITSFDEDLIDRSYVTPRFNEVPINYHSYPSGTSGYSKAVRKARRDVFVHYRNNVDRKNK